MEQLYNFLSEEANWWGTIFLVIAVVTIDLTWTILVSSFFYLIGIKAPDDNITYYDSIVPINNWRCFFRVWLGACLEEYLYRFFPIFISVEFLLPASSFSAIIAVIIATSIIFGWAYGNFWCIFVQGVAGLLYSLLFLKCGGLTDDYFKAFFAATSAHFIHNYLLILAAHILYKRKYVKLP